MVSLKIRTPRNVSETTISPVTEAQAIDIGLHLDDIIADYLTEHDFYGKIAVRKRFFKPVVM